MKKLRLLDLFSGIGGFSLGMERSGYFETVAFCEIKDFPRRVLRKHWPEVPCYHDVHELTATRLAADGIAVDAICGGFPCQDISFAGHGAGVKRGTRSGLWYEYARLIGELRPRVVVVENVRALLSRGLDAVLGNLARLGYDAEWDCIPASALGARHRRERIWIVAYAHGDRELQLQGVLKNVWRWIGNGSQEASNANSIGDANGGWWDIEPNVGRVANGVPDRVHRLAALGNAVVPQIPELIGRAIGEAVEAQP